MNPKNFIEKMLLIVTIFFFMFPIHVFAEAGLSEAGRTEYYIWDSRFGISILPGGEGGDGEDYVSIFEYKEVEDRSEEAMINGEDGKKYAYVKNGIHHGFYSPPFITNDIIWDESYILDLFTATVLYDESYLCTNDENVVVEHYSLEDEKCQNYTALAKKHALSRENADTAMINQLYASKQLNYMGTDAFLEDLGRFAFAFLSVAIILAILFIIGAIILIISLIRYVSKMSFKKPMIIGISMMAIPVILFLGWNLYILFI